jgi:hypothetical protein
MVVFGILAVALFGWITMTLWNWLVPVLFNGPVISIWQAFGLLILSKILFSGFSGGKGRGHWGYHRGGYWKPYWKERYDRMSPEEREKLKVRMKEKWCDWEEPTQATSGQEQASTKA